MATPLRPATIAANAAGQSRPAQMNKKDFRFFMKNIVKLRGNATSDTSSMNVAPATAHIPRKPHAPKAIRRRHNPHQLLDPNTDKKDVMSWLEADCPHDLLPRVLAFAGPQTTAALSRTCRFWKDFIDKESTWRDLCQELHKVSSAHASDL
jgi:hypothetical protein